MKGTRDRGQQPAGKHARPRAGSRTRPRERTRLDSRPFSPALFMTGLRRLTIIGAVVAALLWCMPVGSAAADPKPTLKQLAKRVEKLHEQIGTLTEQYNGERVRLQQARRAAELAKKKLQASQAELEAHRSKATLLAQNIYMSGGLNSALALTTSADPGAFLDQAATTYALQQRQGKQLAEVSKAMKAAERARESAKARAAEVTKLVAAIEAKRAKIRELVKQAESRLFQRVMQSTGSVGNRTKVTVPIIGSGKAAQAARWALTQQLKPYIWGAEGPHGFDCSGLVKWAYAKVGISLPHYTGAQWTAGTRIAKEDLRPGDLVFFYSDLHHVGIYIGGGMMVHAPRTGDVIHVTSINNRPYAGAVRIAD